MGKMEASKPELEHAREAPPPYSEQHHPGPASARPAQMATSQNQAKQAPIQAPQPQINRQFPPQFSLYNSGPFTRTYTIGEHQAQPIYAVTTHTGWSGQPNVVLHNGPSENSPPLAGVGAGGFSRSATIELPPLPGSGLAAAEEHLEFNGFGHGTHSFMIEVGDTGRRERFEWRHSHGAEIDALGGWASGWKLIRHATGVPGGAPEKGSHFVGGGAHSSDGKEVVAVWANAKMSMSKLLNFRFIGSGASGALGERWAVMAVITALRIWDKERKARRSNAGVAGGAAAAAG